MVPDLSIFLTLSLGATNIPLMVLIGFEWTVTPFCLIFRAMSSVTPLTYGTVTCPLDLVALVGVEVDVFLEVGNFQAHLV